MPLGVFAEGVRRTVRVRALHPDWTRILHLVGFDSHAFLSNHADERRRVQARQFVFFCCAARMLARTAITALSTGGTPSTALNFRRVPSVRYDQA